MDELTAHLDRAWDLLGRGDLAGAATSAREALTVDQESPEAYLLLGLIAAQDGVPEAAMEHLKVAIALEPDDPQAYLNAADLALHELASPEEAVALAMQGLEHATEEPERLDAVLLQAEAQLACETPASTAAATRLVEELPETFPHADLAARAGSLLLDLEHPPRAAACFRQATELDPENADAWYGLGLSAEALGDRRLTVEAWLKTRALDLQAALPAWSLDQGEFEEAAEDALRGLPEEARERLADVPIIATDYPSEETVQDGNDPRILGFFSGVPYPEKSVVMPTGPHLDCILLFKRNIERGARTRAEVALEVRVTLLHETGHFFALDEHQLAELGLA